MARWHVRVNPDNSTKGEITGPGFKSRVALGRAGVTCEKSKREGDGKTPLGCYPVRRVYYRPDVLAAPVCRLQAAALSPALGWCDDPAYTAHYNKLVQLPFSGSHEKLWREDSLYNLILVIGHNDDPPVPGMGSAIFVHVAATGAEPDSLKPTEGCVVMPQPAMLAFLRLLEPDDEILIG